MHEGLVATRVAHMRLDSRNCCCVVVVGLLVERSLLFGFLSCHCIKYVFTNTCTKVQLLDISLESSTYIRLQHRNFSLHIFWGGSKFRISGYLPVFFLNGLHNGANASTKSEF